jgi:carbon-monoxide dehydrogenase medium subunit
MKARAFRYIKPGNLKAALRILHEQNGEAVALSGGQSLLAGLNLRLSAPSLLVDIGGLPELTGRHEEGGFIRIGAATRHAELLQCPLVQTHLPLLSKAAPHIGHVAIRNRGTLGGSLAYSDPAAELPACAVALDATLIVAGTAGEREIRAHDFFKGLFETDLRVGELIVAVKWPKLQAGTKCVFMELARRHGDFAMIGIAARVSVQGRDIREARVVYFGSVEHAALAHRVAATVSGLNGVPADTAAIDHAIRHDLAPTDSAALRADTVRHLAGVLTRRALKEIVAEAA